jgi:glycosyltransferase involved in cell wall biosynthesis
LKIAIVNQPWNHAPPRKGGSIAIWTWEVARRLAARHEVYVYARRDGKEGGYEEIDGIRCVRFPIRTDLRANKWLQRISRRAFDSRFFYRLYLERVARDLGDRRPDVIHMHNFSQHVPIIRRRNPDATIVLHMHCEWLSQLERSRIAARLADADLVLGCSDFITGKTRDRFPEFAPRCRTVYNGVDVDAFAPTPAAGNRGDDRKHVLFVGRITPEKALHVMIESLKLVRDRFPDLQVDIVGPDAETPKSYIVDLSDDDRVRSLAAEYDGRYYERLQSLARNRLGDAARFSGLVHQSHLPPHYRAADLLLNPSFSESFGMSLIEAMACGIPVVATRVGGMTGIVADGETGLVVEPGDAPALAEATSALLADDSRRREMGAAARRRALELFSWERVTEALDALYREHAGVRHAQ